MRAVALLAMAATACSGAAAGPPAVELGTGADQFVPLRDADPVLIIHGIQGGYHVWGSVRAENLSPNGLRLRFTLRPAQDPTPVTVRTDVVDLTNGEHLGTAVFLPDPAAVRGVGCRLQVAVSDENGRTAASERLVVPQ